MFRGGLSVRGSFYIHPYVQWRRAYDGATNASATPAFVDRETGSFVSSGLSETSYIITFSDDMGDGMLLVQI